MPLWRIFAHPSTFSFDQKKGIADAVTKLYTSEPINLPAFYVNVLFIPLKEDECVPPPLLSSSLETVLRESKQLTDNANRVFIGGQPRKNFVRIVIEQIARQMPDPSTEEGRGARMGWMDMINEVLLSLYSKERAS